MEHLFCEFYKERQGADTILKPEGFIIYKINGPECFIVNMFIEKKSRGTYRFRAWLDELSKHAESKGCQFLSANIYLNDPGATHTLRSSLSYGFKVSDSGIGVLLISKNIKGDSNG